MIFGFSALGTWILGSHSRSISCTVIGSTVGGCWWLLAVFIGYCLLFNAHWQYKKKKKIRLAVFLFALLSALRFSALFVLFTLRSMGKSWKVFGQSVGQIHGYPLTNKPVNVCKFIETIKRAFKTQISPKSLFCSLKCMGNVRFNSIPSDPNRFDVVDRSSRLPCHTEWVRTGMGWDGIGVGKWIHFLFHRHRCRSRYICKRYRYRFSSRCVACKRLMGNMLITDISVFLLA